MSLGFPPSVPSHFEKLPRANKRSWRVSAYQSSKGTREHWGFLQTDFNPPQLSTWGVRILIHPNLVWKEKQPNPPNDSPARSCRTPTKPPACGSACRTVSAGWGRKSPKSGWWSTYPCIRFGVVGENGLSIRALFGRFQLFTHFFQLGK